ncbi:MAG: hypothetical protein P8Z70_01420 [Desulfuromonadales bacterium]|jgi:hypothetical protein
MKNPNPVRLREAWVLCFLLGVVMINFPFIHIFNKDTQVLGIPMLVFYLMVGWPVSIAVIYLFSRSLGKESTEEEDGEEGRKSPE